MIKINRVLYRGSKKPIVWDAFFNDNGNQKPLVVFCHGYKGFKDWGSWNLLARAFMEAGLFFVKFNFSHNGGTVENPIDFPDLDAFAENNYSKELDDVDSLLNHLLSKNNPFIKNINTHDITLIGHSRGGGISIIKASEDTRITKLITLASVCGFEKRTATIGDLKEWKEKGVKYVLNGRTKQQMPHHYQFYEDYIANKERLNIKSATEKLAIPQLIIHGNNDTSINIKEAEELHRWNPNSKLKIIEGADHVFNTKHPWEATELSPELEAVVTEIQLFSHNK